MAASVELDQRLVATAASWLLAWLLHSTTLLGCCWLFLRVARGLRDGVQECLWKFAAVAPLATAWLPFLAVALPPSANAGGQGPQAAARLPGAMTSVLALPELRTLPVVSPLPLDLPLLIVAAAGVMAAAAAAFALRDRLALRALLCQRAPVTDERMRRLLDELVQKAGVRFTVRLTVCAALRSPIAFGVRAPEICVPPEVDQLDRDQQRSMLAHELAHLVHRDPLWLAVLSLYSCLFPWQPLLRVARRQLRELAEFRCDGWAAQRTGGMALARCLVQVAGWVEAAPLAAVAGMASGPTALGRRVDRLLEERPVRGLGRDRLWLLPVLLVLTVALAAAMPAAGFDRPPPPAAPGREVLALEFRALTAEVAELRRELLAVELDDELTALVERLDLALRRLEQHRRRLLVLDRPAAPDAASAGTTSRKER